MVRYWWEKIINVPFCLDTEGKKIINVRICLDTEGKKNNKRSCLFRYAGAHQAKTKVWQPFLLVFSRKSFLRRAVECTGQFIWRGTLIYSPLTSSSASSHTFYIVAAPPLFCLLLRFLLIYFPFASFFISTIRHAQLNVNESSIPQPRQLLLPRLDAHTSGEDHRLLHVLLHSAQSSCQKLTSWICEKKIIYSRWCFFL